MRRIEKGVEKDEIRVIERKRRNIEGRKDEKRERKKIRCWYVSVRSYIYISKLLTRSSM